MVKVIPTPHTEEWIHACQRADVNMMPIKIRYMYLSYQQKLLARTPVLIMLLCSPRAQEKWSTTQKFNISNSHVHTIIIAILKMIAIQKT